MSTAAGSKRRATLHGYTVTADPGDLTLLRRQSAALLARLFREAQDHGQSHLAIDGTTFLFHRHADHTFTITRNDHPRPTPW